MKFSLSNKEWKQVIAAIAELPLNFGYNVERKILSLLKVEDLSNSAMDALDDEKSTEADFPCDETGWGLIVNALGEQKYKNVFQLENKLLQNVSPEAEKMAQEAFMQTPPEKP